MRGFTAQRRVEVAAPVLDRDLCRRLTDMFRTMLQDNQQARELRGDGEKLMRTFRRWAARTILSSTAAAVAISILICRLLT